MKEHHMNRSQTADEDRQEEAQSDGPNALEMLRKDHQKVQELFEQFEGADNRSRQGIGNQILTELEIHATLEETLIYPAIREALDEDDMMDEALEEHHVVKAMIKELRKMQPKDDRYRAKFKVLSEIVKHHVEEEESEILPQAEETDLDFDALGQEALVRKEKLIAKMGGTPSTGKSNGNKRKVA
jgi:hemerythrin superfamily protein